MGNSEPAKFLPFHFVKFASLISLVKDKLPFAHSLLLGVVFKGLLNCQLLRYLFDLSVVSIQLFQRYSDSHLLLLIFKTF